LKRATLITLLLLLFCANQSVAQNVKWNTYRGKNHVKKGDFSRAIYFFNRALKKDSTHYPANIGLGRVYLYNYQVFDSALFYVDRALRNSGKDSSSFDLYDFANANRYNNNPEVAIKYYKHFRENYIIKKGINNPELDSLIDQSIQFCNRSKVALVNQNTDISVDNMDFYINSRESEYTPVYIENDSSLMFNARYKDLKSEKQFADYQYMENVYYFDFEESAASTFDESLGQGSHHAVVGKNPGSDTIVLFYQNILWVGSTFQKRLTEPVPLPENLSDFHFQPHGVFSTKQDTFYFSAMKTEFDNLDIYYSVKNENGEWSEPAKVPGKINTNFREDSPFLADNGKTMYFSSEGHNSSGGYDVFKSELINGEWSEPERMPYPINSAGHDIYFTLDQEGEFGYISSNRLGGFGLMDIYNVSMIPQPTFDCPLFENPSLIAELDISGSIDTGSVALQYEWVFEDGEKLFGPTVSKDFKQAGNHYIYINIKDIEGGQVEEEEVVEELVIDSINWIGFRHNTNYIVGDTAHLDASVSYIEGVDLNHCYWMLGDSILSVNQFKYDYALTETGVFPVSIQIYGSDGETSFSYCQTDTLVVRELDTTAIDTNIFVDNNNSNNNNDNGTNINTTDADSILNNGEKIELDFEPIYFAFDKSNIDEQAVSKLNKLISYLNANPEARLIIEGHTDAMGSNDYNEGLAIRRIEATVEYLKGKGVNMKRVYKTIGKGETDPAAPNVKPDGSDNFNGRKLNRRVEFQVVK